MNFGEKLKQLRKQSGKSQAQVVDEIRAIYRYDAISQAHLSTLENKEAAPRQQTLELLAAYYKIPASYFLADGIVPEVEPGVVNLFFAWRSLPHAECAEFLGIYGTLEAAKDACGEDHPGALAWFPPNAEGVSIGVSNYDDTQFKTGPLHINTRHYMTGETALHGPNWGKKHTREEDAHKFKPCSWNGIEYDSIKDAAEANGIDRKTMQKRLSRGFTCDDDMVGSGNYQRS